MTKKKAEQDEYSSYELALYRLRLLAKKLDMDVPLEPSERTFLIEALRNIGSGGDPKQVLQIKGGRGVRRGSKDMHANLRRDMILSWIVLAP